MKFLILILLTGNAYCQTKVHVPKQDWEIRAEQDKAIRDKKLNDKLRSIQVNDSIRWAKERAINDKNKRDRERGKFISDSIAFAKGVDFKNKIRQVRSDFKCDKCILFPFDSISTAEDIHKEYNQEIKPLKRERLFIQYRGIYDRLFKRNEKYVIYGTLTNLNGDSESYAIDIISENKILIKLICKSTEFKILNEIENFPDNSFIVITYLSDYISNEALYGTATSNMDQSLMGIDVAGKILSVKVLN